MRVLCGVDTRFTRYKRGLRSGGNWQRADETANEIYQEMSRPRPVHRRWVVESGKRSCIGCEMMIFWLRPNVRGCLAEGFLYVSEGHYSIEEVPERDIRGVCVCMYE